MTARHATERNQDQAEEALRQSDERLRALVQNLSDVITVFDRDGTIRWSSPATERVFGRRPGEDDRAHPLNQIHPDDAERVEALLSSQLPRPGVGEPIEFRVRHADGSWRHVEAVVSNLLDDPAVGGIVFTTRDISERREAEEALRRSEARYRAIVEDQTELIARHRLDGTLTFVNDAACRYFGRSREEQLGDSFVPTVHPDDREAVARALEALSAERPVAAIENRVVLPTGEVRWQQWTNRAILDGEGRVVEYQAVGRDITEQKEAEAHLADQARVLEMIAKGRPLHETLDETCRIVQRRFPGALPVLLLIDDDGSSFRVEAAPGLPEGCGPALEEVGFVPPTSSFEARHRRLVTDGAAPGWAALHEVVAAHGLSVSWAAPILEASGERVLGALVVLTAEPRGPQPGEERLVAQAVHLASIAVERKAFETRLAHQAHHDPLTGLPNRVLFVEFLVHALARARRQLTSVAVLFLDCDRFKVVNDSLGHDAGDELLVQLARRLQTVLRPGDTVARFGGDEFVVLCEDLTAASARQQAVEVAERLLEAIQQPFVLNGDESFLSASIGIALSGGPDEGPEALLRDADVAMYRAKDRGKGRWELFDEAMRATALARLETETALHRAIDRGSSGSSTSPSCRCARDGASAPRR
ncbi:MAG: diguanylate cyclase [Acidimicrobiia bacterium]|nr:diguanylate cyclase [Acidimicrobiia bacterium]